MILKEGLYGDRFYLICSGKVQLELDDDGRPPVKIQVLGADEVLGWSWIYPPFAWHFTARVLETCETVELKAAALLIRAEEDPAFGYQLMKRVSMQLSRRLQVMGHLLRSNLRSIEGQH